MPVKTSNIQRLTCACERVVSNEKASIGLRKGVAQALITLQEDSILQPWLFAAGTAVETDVGDGGLTLLERNSWSSLHPGGSDGCEESNDAGELHYDCI